MPTIPTNSQETNEGRQNLNQIHAGIYLDAHTDLLETIRKIHALTNLEKVDVYLELSFCKGTSDDFHLLMEAIGSLPKLISLRLRSDSFTGRFVQLPFSTLKVLLEASKKSLKHLCLSNVDFYIPEKASFPLIGLANLLEDNNNLQELRIDLGGRRKIRRSAQRALVHLLQYKNFSLKLLEFDKKTIRQFSSYIRKQMQFYLALNQAGLRQKLLDPNASATDEEWEEAVISNRGQSSTVYYLLSNNPTMVCA